MMTWILCPNLWGARLFVSDNPDENPRFLREYPRPQTHLRKEDFDEDEDIPELTETPEDHQSLEKVARTYCEQLSHALEHAADHHSYDSLILCAEKHFLEILKKKLGPHTRSRLVGTIEEDLYEVNETDLANYIQDFRRRIRKKGVA